MDVFSALLCSDPLSGATTHVIHVFMFSTSVIKAALISVNTMSISVKKTAEDKSLDATHIAFYYLTCETQISLRC